MEDTVFSRNDTSIKENNTIEKNVPGDVDEHLPEMTLIRNVMPSMEELNAVEKDFFKRLEKPGDSDKHLQRMALNRNDRPCTKEQSVVEKDESKRLDEVKAVEDLGVSEREDEVEGDEDLQGVNEKQEEESKVGKISTKSGSTHLYSQGESEILILARGICESSNLIDKAVVTVHNGMIYQVVSIIHDTTAKSPFPSKKDSKPRYDSYSDYFQKMHGKKLKHLNQPLLMVKHVEQLYNFLVKDQQKPIVNEGKFVELPPELCLNLGVSSSVMRSLYLVPSVMHRLTSLMLASQLHKAIREERSDCPPVPASLIMEALTSRKCSECFSYERLELLGDSFLKFVISQHLFMKYENEDEGQLSARRAEAVCNKTLHRLALDHNLEGYIIDELFDVCKWVAPGLFFRSIVPCTCNSGDPNSLRMGKVCDKGHRWIYSKTISDVVEALIGAHLVGGGTNAALEFMRWMNMEVDIEDKSVKIAFNHSFAHPNAFKTERLNTSLDELQLLLRYHFENPCLLMEALTHASINERGRCSYQRLEFLGDSVLDLLITQYLYSTYQELSPGTLSDLRQVAVNNENFAQAIVKHGIHNYIHHNSDELRNQIAKFVEDFERCKGGDCQFISFGGGMRAPKVLGDLIESISGAILVDTRLKPNVVWDKIYPILSPIVTPENVVPQPLRELYELCDQQHYKYNWKPIIKTGNVYAATIQIQLEDFNIYGEGSNKNSKLAMTKAVIDALAQLRVKGICHGRYIFVQSTIDTIGNEAPRLSNLIAQEKMIIASSPQIDSGEVDQCCGGQVDQEKNLLYSSKSMQGVYRKNLNEVCQKMHFRRPKFELIEEVGMPHENRFLFKVMVDIPNKESLSIQGKQERDYAHAKDSAAYNMLVELQKHGLCSI